MEPIETLPPNSETSSPPSPLGELVVQHGRQAGACRPLVALLTLIGRAPGCDLRLNVDSVAPQHCAIFPAPTGLVLRDLGTDSGTFVNDQRVNSCLLKDGDVLAVGPFKLLVRCPQTAVEKEAGETDALRVHAAAMAAQQAALLEEENRLQQRRVALEKQEEQLASHLEERRQELVQLKEQVRQQRTQLQLERANLDQERRDRLSEAERDRAEAAQLLTREKQERQRLTELRRRLRKRWKKHWKVQEQTIKAREKAVENRQLGFAQDEKKLEMARAELMQARLKLNGERELTRRQLQDERNQLRQARQSWQAEKKRHERDLAGHRKRLEAEGRTLKQSRDALEAWRQEAQTMRDQLVRESEGLENRVRNLRQAMAQLEARRGEVLPNAVSPSPMNVETQRWLARLEIVAGVLADQRLLLVDQWQCFLEAQEQWRRQQAELLPQLEQTARHLQDREQQLDQREQALRDLEESHRQRQEALSAMRLELEAAQTRVKIGESAWNQERINLLARVDQAEEAMQRCQGKLDDLRKQWSARRKEELARLIRELHRARDLQRLYTTLREEYEQRSLELSGLQRSLAERSLAVEQLELERLGQSEDPVVAEKRLHKLRRHFASQYEDEEQRLAERGRNLEAEAARLTAQAQQLHKRLAAVSENEATLSARQTEWEHRLAKEEHAREELQRRMVELQRQEQTSEHRRRELQEELDRLVALLLRDERPDQPLAA